MIGVGISLFASRSAAWVPTRGASLFAAPNIAAARSAGLLWQDAAKTVPAVADGDPVYVVRCPFTAVEFAAPAVGQRPLLKSGGGSLWHLLFDGTDDFLTFSGPASKPLSIHMACRVTNFSIASAAFSSPAGGQKLKIVDPGALNKMRGGKEGVYNWTESTTAATVSADFVGGVNYAATGAATYYRNGAADGVADADTSDDTFTANLSRIGASSSGAELIVGRVYGWAIYSASQSVGNLLALHKYLGAQAGMVI